MPAAAVGAAIEHSCFSSQIKKQEKVFLAFINFRFPDFLLLNRSRVRTFSPSTVSDLQVFLFLNSAHPPDGCTDMYSMATVPVLRVLAFRTSPLSAAMGSSQLTGRSE
jgi:hypothetical protein